MSKSYYLRIGSDMLEEAVPYPTKAQAIDAFREVAEELATIGQAIDATLHIAESRETIHEYPDCILSLGPRGGVKVETT